MTSIAAVLPVPTAGCPDWARGALYARAGATITGQCPACGERISISADPDGTPLALGGLAHSPGCPAVDPRLEQLGPDDVELCVFLLDYPDERAA